MLSTSSPLLATKQPTRKTGFLRKGIWLFGVVVGLVLIAIVLIVSLNKSKNPDPDPDPDPGTDPGTNPDPLSTHTVLDFKSIKVSFPSMSKWTPTGFPGPTAFSVKPPYEIPKEIIGAVTLKIQQTHPDFKAPNQGLMFLDNTAQWPEARTFFVFQMPVGTNNGNTVAVMRAQNTKDPRNDEWTVAWGNISPAPSPYVTIPSTVTVTPDNISSGNMPLTGKLYWNATESGDNPQTGGTGPLQMIGPGCIGDNDIFFVKAKEALGDRWKDSLHETAIYTKDYTTKDGLPSSSFFYYMQVSSSLAIGCTMNEGQWTCTVGTPSHNLAQFPCT